MNTTEARKVTRPQSLLILAVAVTLIFAVFQYQDKNKILNQVNAGYQRSYNNMLDNLANIKDMLVNVSQLKIPSQQMGVFAEIWKEADSAKKSLALMPYDQDTVNKCSIYLSEMINQSYRLMKKSMSRTGLDMTDMEVVQKLKDYTSVIHKSITEVGYLG